MKILQIHNSYQQKGGEDAVVQSERELLESKNQVLTYTINNDSIHGLAAKITTSLPNAKEPFALFVGRFSLVKRVMQPV